MTTWVPTWMTRDAAELAGLMTWGHEPYKGLGFKAHLDVDDLSDARVEEQDGAGIGRAWTLGSAIEVRV